LIFDLLEESDHNFGRENGGNDTLDEAAKRNLLWTMNNEPRTTNMNE